MLTSRRRTNYPGVLAIQENLNHSIEHEINRGYHMVARRYKVSVRVLKNTNCWNIFQHEKRKFCTSKRFTKVLFIKTPMKYQAISLQHFYRERREFVCHHGNGDLLPCEDIPTFSCYLRPYARGLAILPQTQAANDRPRFAVSGFTLAVCPYLGHKIRGWLLTAALFSWEIVFKITFRWKRVR